MESVRGAVGRRWCEKYVKSVKGEGEARLVAEQWPRLDIVDAEFKGQSVDTAYNNETDTPDQSLARSWSRPAQLCSSL